MRPGGSVFAMEGLREAEVDGDFQRHRYELEAGRTRSIIHLVVPS